MNKENEHGKGYGEAKILKLRSRKRLTTSRWRIERIEVVPMTPEQYSSAVNALAALYLQWQQRKAAEQKKVA